jgi:hypothetical protein
MEEAFRDGGFDNTSIGFLPGVGIYCISSDTLERPRMAKD